MNTHFEHDELTDAAAGLLGTERLGHLEGCEACRRRVDDLQASLKQWRERASGAAVRPEAEWTRQRNQIMARVGEQRRASTWRLIFAGALAAATAALIFALVPLKPHHPQPQTNPAAITSSVSDEQLIQSVEAALDRETPEALEPATLLTKDIDRSASKNANRNPRGVKQ